MPAPLCLSASTHAVARANEFRFFDCKKMSERLLYVLAACDIQSGARNQPVSEYSAFITREKGIKLPTDL